MCGRARQSMTAEELAIEFSIRGGRWPNLQARWNGAPTQDFGVVRRNPQTGERALDTLRWGLVPAWAKDDKISYSTFNAKAETVAEKPTFRAAWKAGRRCLIPVDAFYEWQTLGPKTKQPYAIARADGRPAALGGLWESKRLEGDAVLRSFTILTTTPNAVMARFHDRMPVIIAPEDYAAWLGEIEPAPEQLAALMAPCPDAWLKTWPVDPRMSNVRNQGEEFCQAIDLAAG